MKNIWKNGMMGLVLGDALGMPVQFVSRAELKKNPVTTMEGMIKSTGYVVDSLEAAIWSLITTKTLEEGLLKAVNLGDDTDTVGAIAGGLAALYYGYESAPEEWRNQIIKEEEIIQLCEIMEGSFDVR